jgi:hypothetical protein
MSNNTEGAPLVHVDEQQLDVFLHNYFNLDLPAGSVSTILTSAFNALIAAGVVVLDDGTPAQDVEIKVHGGRVQMTTGDPDTGKETGLMWTPQGGMPSFDPAITGLAQLLVAILNSPPWKGKSHFPYTRN